MQDLVLGTAQWGDAYGITNATGRLSDEVLRDIVSTARTLGIRAVDTAAAYGDAELRLAPWAGELAIGTKVSGALPVSVQLRASLERLGLERVHTCLVHDWSSLTRNEASAAARELVGLQEDGLVDQVGVSAYDEADLITATELFESVGCAQVPTNVLDRRLDESVIVHELAAKGTQFQIRSVFLQGLLAARSLAGLGSHPDVVAFHDGCDREGVSPLRAALAFVRSCHWATQVVVGATSASELMEIATAWAGAGSWWPEPAGPPDLELIDPRRWVREEQSVRIAT